MMKHEMTRQEIFDAVWQHFVVEERAPGGLVCRIGERSPHRQLLAELLRAAEDTGCASPEERLRAAARCLGVLTPPRGVEPRCTYSQWHAKVHRNNGLTQGSWVEIERQILGMVNQHR